MKTKGTLERLVQDLFHTSLEQDSCTKKTDYCCPFGFEAKRCLRPPTVVCDDMQEFLKRLKPGGQKTTLGPLADCALPMFECYTL